MSAQFPAPPTDSVPPRSRVVSLAFAHLAARCLHIVASLGIADFIGDRPLAAGAIARSAKVDADALDRMLRLLSAHGLFKSGPDGWAHTPASRLLRSDHPQSLGALASLLGDPMHWDAMTRLDHSLTTGTPASSLIHADGFWDFYDVNSDFRRQFDAAMTAQAHANIIDLLGVLDVAGVETVADIAGGRGHCLVALLDAHPALKGVLFEQPAVLEKAFRHPRMTTMAGDFFTDAMPAADLYLMTHIIHDWPDDDAVRILSQLRKAAPSGARLVIYELVLPEEAAPPLVLAADVIMMALVSGRERTAKAYADLFAKSGWTSDGTVATPGPMALHVARAG